MALLTKFKSTCLIRFMSEFIVLGKSLSMFVTKAICFPYDNSLAIYNTSSTKLLNENQDN
jgi:hypothetical protein